MQRDLQDLRKNYTKGALVEGNVPDMPLELFNEWFTAASNDTAVDEVNAMSLCTLGIDGFPKSRIVLLKEIEQGHFVFYTNYESEKGKSMSAFPKVSLHFFWPAMERQIIIKGMVSKVSREKSLAYFKSRPRGSQLGAWASNQSESVATRAFLQEQLDFFTAQFEEKEIPLPDFWGGYAVRPVSFEFWQGRPNRLHDRIFYEFKNDQWTQKRLAP